MLTVKNESFDDLADSEKNEVPNNGSGKEYAGYLRVILDGASVALYSDAMELEDARFCRDLKWIKGAIEAAYNAGFDSRPSGGAKTG